MASYFSGIDFSKPAPRGELEDVFADDLEEWDKVRRTAMGYPRNWIVHKAVQDMMKKVADYGVHNVGDWEGGSRFAPSAFSYEFEMMLFFMELFKCPGGEENYWGYFDASGSSGNLWCATVGKEVLKQATGKDPVMIYSKAAHYSFQTAVLQNGLKSKTVDENDDGSVDIDALKDAFGENSHRPIWMGILCGGTVKEGRDNIRKVLEAAKATGRPRSDFFFHVDGAFSAMPLALMDDPADADIIPNFSLDVGGGFTIDSVNVSPHKFAGILEPAGMMLMKRVHSDAIAFNVEYIQSVNKTQIGSRNARPIIECWALIKYLGKEVLTQWARACASRARQMKKDLAKAGVEDILLNRNALTIYCKEFSPELSLKHRLAPERGYVHIIITPHTLHPNELGKNREGELFQSYDTANTFIEAVRKALSD